MELVTLDKRHKYYKHGFVAAIRSTNYGYTEFKVDRYLASVYGAPPVNHANRIHNPWIMYSTPWGSSTVYWICVKNPAILTLALLSIDY